MKQPLAMSDGHGDYVRTLPSGKHIEDNCGETESRRVLQSWSKLLEKNLSDITRDSNNMMKMPMFAIDA